MRLEFGQIFVSDDDGRSILNIVCSSHFVKLVLIWYKLHSGTLGIKNCGVGGHLQSEIARLEDLGGYIFPCNKHVPAHNLLLNTLHYL